MSRLLSDARPWTRACVALLAVGFVAPGDPKPGDRTRLVWTGEVVERDARAGKFDMSTIQYKETINQSIRFRYVQEDDRQREALQFASRTISWTSEYSFASLSGNGTCNGSGSVDLGPGPDPHVGVGSRAKEMVVPCKSEVFQSNRNFAGLPPRQIKPPSLPSWSQLRNDCSYSEERPGYRFSVTVAPEIDAVMDVGALGGGPYAAFLPRPGATIAFSVHSSVPVLFKFELRPDEVSHYPGYASNGNIDARFYRRFPKLQHLQGRYKNDDADLLFDPNDYKNGNWKQPAHGDLVETLKESTGATAIVTAMDHAAWGRLRAYAKVKCGGWQPVRVVLDVGGERDAVTIPMDENDNLLADKWERQYEKTLASVNPGDDPDSDGLTNFEEYRGFTENEWCAWDFNSSVYRHDPTSRDLFVHSSDDSLMFAVDSIDFWGSGRPEDAVSTSIVCADDLLGPPDAFETEANAKIINFTLHQAGLKSWRGKKLTLDEPQHALVLVDKPLPVKYGVVCGYGAQCEDPPPALGPPKNVRIVVIDKSKMVRAGMLDYYVLHELGHAIGLHHHGDGNVWGPAVILDTPACPRGTSGGLVDGRHACRTEFIAVIHGENSGNSDCPMRYVKWRWYTHDDFSLVSNAVTFLPDEGGPAETLPAYRGTLSRYDKDSDMRGLRPLCSSVVGTGVNAGGHHTGDAVHTCSGGIRVRDAP